MEEELLKALVAAVPIKYQMRYGKTLKGTAPFRVAIATKCLDCCGWHATQEGPDGESVKMINNCLVRGCPLWAYRPGSGMKRKTRANKPLK